MLTPELFAAQLAIHNAAVAASPADANALKLRAQFYTLHHDDKMLAIADLRETLQLHLSRGNRKPGGVLAEGRRWLKRALGNASGSFRFYFLAQAIAHFDAATERAPDNATIYRDRAIAWTRLRERARAQSDFAQMRALRGETRQSWRVEAEAFSSPYAPDYEAATAAFRRAIELNPQTPTLAICLRHARTRRILHWQVMAYIDLAIEIAPHNVEPLVMRAGWWMRNQQQNKADADWQRALELQPDDPTIYEARAYFTNPRSGFERAVADYARALRLRIAADPALGTPKMLHQRARALKNNPVGCSEDTRVFAVYSVAIERDPRCTMSYVLRAALTRRMFTIDDDPYAEDDYQTAHPMLERALEDEMHALWLNPRLKAPCARIVAHFSESLRGRSAHQQLEGLLKARLLLTDKGLEKHLVEKIGAEIEAKLRET